MTPREAAFAVALAAAGISITYGVALVSAPVAFIVGGVLLGLVAWAVLAE